MNTGTDLSLTVGPDLPRADRLTGLFEPATVVLFAGLGGVCIGQERAYVRGGFRDKYVDLAVNHWTTAVGVHELNHPMTQHLRADVVEVDPDDVLRGRRIAALHLSPDCTDFSKAKGSRPKRKHIRALAWVGIEWAAKRRPDVITLENVEEFQDWGPLTRDRQPCPRRRGQTFRKWVQALRRLGYQVEWRELRACDYGAPTTRKRLFVIARCDGLPICWPAPTHGPAGSGLLPYRTAAECIDWSEPMLSVFASRAEAAAWSRHQNRGKRKGEPRVGIPQRPLKPKTQHRLARGLLKFVLEARRPFLVSVQNGGWDKNGTRDAGDPMATVTATPKGGGWAVAEPRAAAFHGTFNHAGAEHRCQDVREPVGTVCASRDARGVCAAAVAPYTVPNLGERPGQAPRCGTVEVLMPTVTAKGNGARLSAAHVVKHFGGVTGKRADAPADTVTGVDHHAVSVAYLVQYHSEKGGEVRAHDPAEPVRTLDTQPRFAPAAAHVVKFRGESTGSAADAPCPTVTSGAGAARNAGAAHALGTAVLYLSHFYTSNTCGGEGDPAAPAKTVTSGGQHAMFAAAYVQSYYGSGSGLTGHAADAPAPTTTAKARFNVATALVGGWPLTLHQLLRAKQLARWARRLLGHAIDKHLVWVVDAHRGGAAFPLVRMADPDGAGPGAIVWDLAMRMFKPRELARCQGFPEDYVIDRTSDGRRISTADQVKLIGNSVPPQFSEAIAWENVVKPGVLEGGRKAVAS